jgi:hypothetical protein
MQMRRREGNWGQARRLGGRRGKCPPLVESVFMLSLELRGAVLAPRPES